MAFLENTLEGWLQYFRSKLDRDNFVQKKITNEGPKTEMIFWKNALQEMVLLFELTNTPDFVFVRDFLQNKNKKLEERRSSLLSEAKSVESLISDRINEAKDNIKYLGTLDKFIEPLYNGTPEEIIETLPALMNAIKMIHTISRYYNTSKILTVLFTKITNQIIVNCKERILRGKTHEDIWGFEPNDLIAVFQSCIVLAQNYKSSYEQTKKKAAELIKSRHWDFDDGVIFLKLDFFVKRVKKLIELFTTIEQFNELEKH